MGSCPFYRQCQYSLVNLTMDPLLDGPPVYFFCRGGLGRQCLRQIFRGRSEQKHPVPLNFSCIEENHPLQ